MEEITRSVSPDNRNRIALGDLAKGVSRFDIIVNPEDDTITLKPYVDIPRREAWLWQDNKALAATRQGMTEAKKGKTAKPEITAEEDIAAEIARLKDEF